MIHPVLVDTTKAGATLGMTFRGIKETIPDSVKGLMARVDSTLAHGPKATLDRIPGVLASVSLPPLLLVIVLL